MNRIISLFLLRLVAVFAASLANISQTTPLYPIPTDDAGNYGTQVGHAGLPTLSDFTRQVTNGNAADVTGVYVTDVFALTVVKQPAGDPAYISTRADALTEFSLAKAYGSLGFVAHNTLAGRLFTKIQAGDLLIFIYGDGRQTSYHVDQIRHFKALSPNSPYSNYVDLEQGKQLSNSDLFFQTYGTRGTAILQTCIAANGLDSWGRLFIIATPYLPSLIPTTVKH